MADEAMTRVEIGFDGGLIMSMRLNDTEWARLESALAADERGPVALAGDDVTYHVDLRKLCYVKHERHVGRVGF